MVKKKKIMYVCMYVCMYEGLGPQGDVVWGGLSSMETSRIPISFSPPRGMYVLRWTSNIAASLMERETWPCYWWRESTYVRSIVYMYVCMYVSVCLCMYE